VRRAEWNDGHEAPVESRSGDPARPRRRAQDTRAENQASRKMPDWAGA